VFDACGGDAVEDCFGVCNGSAVVDCSGECDGSAVVDVCGDCNGGITDSNDCSYFNVGINPTGVNQLVIFQTSITGLQDGDEIGVFDANAILESGGCSSPTGELLVGTDVWSGAQINLANIGSIDNCAFGGTQLPGFVDANPVVVKVYRDGIIYDTKRTCSCRIC
jgi:hypothetical protein